MKRLLIGISVVSLILLLGLALRSSGAPVTSPSGEFEARFVASDSTEVRASDVEVVKVSTGEVVFRSNSGSFRKRDTNFLAWTSTNLLVAYSGDIGTFTLDLGLPNPELDSVGPDGCLDLSTMVGASESNMKRLRFVAC